MKALKITGITVLSIVVILVLVAGYFGFMPGVSNLFGSNQPRDLGVKYTAADYASAHAKNGTTHTIITSSTSPENSIKFSGSHPVNTTYTQSEFNAEINNRQWEYYPLEKCQLRINPDNTVEFSGILKIDRLKDYLTAMRVGDDNMNVITDYLKMVPTDPAIYVKGSLEIEDSRIIKSQVMEFKVGNLALTGQIQEKMPEIVNAAYAQINAYPGLTVKTLKFANGKVQFEGTLPDSARTISH
jgi:hypothetical protein